MSKLYKLGFREHGNKYRQIQVSTCVPFPGTRLYEKLKNKIKKYDQEIDDQDLYDGNMNTIMTYMKNE
ncbi:MAG: hypothetical protein GX638_13235 [Crenarchaeota archaeon]|nr:hypothetical protein [Thermoproteota archaeon]